MLFSQLVRQFLTYAAASADRVLLTASVLADERVVG